MNASGGLVRSTLRRDEYVSMAATNRSSGARDEDEEVTCTVTIGLRGLLLRETNREYPEKNTVLRVWHPGFLDFQYVGHQELMRAVRNGDMTTYVPLVFKKVRPSKFDRAKRVLTLPESAMLGLQLFAQTANDAGQDCVKPQGAYRGVLLRRVHVDYGTLQTPITSFKDVMFIEECLEGMRVPGTAYESSDGIKATATEMYVRTVLRGAKTEFVSSAFGSLTAGNYNDRARNMIRSHVTELYNYHETVRISVAKARKYYSLQYKVAEGISLPASAYMMHMMGPDSVPPSAGVVHALFASAINAHPEFAETTAKSGARTPTDLWVLICDEFINSDAAPTPRDPATGPTFMDCLRVAMHVLTAYPNSVPYLLDMEVDTTGKVKGNPQLYAHAVEAMHSAGNAGGTYNEEYSCTESVERFACAVMETYGTDCEDFAMFAYWLKNMIQKTYIASDDHVLRTLARVYELFIACVSHMFCKGDDAQTVKDDGVYHFATYMLPRLYVSECWERAKPSTNLFAQRIHGARAWEKNYRAHLGAFIIEGTNTVDAAQFRMCEHIEGLRESNTQRACAGIRGISTNTTRQFLNVFHSYVYANPKQLSGFYRWTLSMFCGETDRPNIIDLAFFDGSAKGVRVEALASMSNTVSIRQIVRYEKQMFDLCHELIELYRPPYNGLVAVSDRTEMELIACIHSLSPKLRALDGSPPRDIAARRRHVRVHVQHLDFSVQHKDRSMAIIHGLEELAAHIPAKSAQICANVVGASWATACDLTETANDHMHTVVQLYFIFYY